MTTKLRVRYDGSTLVPLEPVDLPTGAVLEADLTEVQGRKENSMQALLKLLESLPQPDPEAWAEFDRAIEEGRQPASFRGVFDDLAESE